MTVTLYKMRFIDLSRNEVVLIPTEREKVWRFIEGLAYGIRLQIARDTETETSLTQVVEITKGIEWIRGQGREVTSDKRPCYFGSFSGASSGGKCSFGRGHAILPVQLVFQVSYGTSGGHGAYGLRFKKPAFSASPTPNSAPPIQIYHGGYSGRQGQLLLQQPRQLRGFYVCRHLRYFMILFQGSQSSMP